MNILQLVPKLNVGGVEKGTAEVARYLTLNGHKAVVVSGGGIFEKNLAAIGARHYNLPVGKKNPFIMLICYYKLREIIRKENIDIVHARSRIPALTGYFAARSTGKTFMTTAHGQYKRHLISRVMGWGKIVVVAGEVMARHMKDNFGVSFHKMKIIPRGVDLKKFGFISPLEKNKDFIRIGMISRFTSIKGHLDFLKAASYIVRKKPNVQIVLMGDRSSAKEEYMKKIELTIRRLMLGQVVKFIDSDKDVAETLKSLNVFVSANRAQEAFGRTVIEAQARGVPVVATRVGGVSENVEDKVTGLLCDPMDPLDMSYKIMKYIEDPSFAERMAIAARKHVEENFSLEYTMKKTIEIYKYALGVKNILVFKISSLGDIMLSVPSLRALRHRFPGASIKILVDKRFREIFDNCPYIDDVIVCDLKGKDRGIRILSLAKKIQREDFNLSIDLQNNRISHLLAFLGRIPERYGYDNGKLSFLINRKINLPSTAIEPIKHQGYVMGLAGVTNLEQKLELWPRKEDKAWVEKFLRDGWLRPDQKIVALSISASKKWVTKNWSIQKLSELTDMLAERKGIRVVILGTNDELEYADKFLKKTKAKPINAVGKTSISKLITLIDRCDAVFTGDSAPMHIAAAVDTPFVAVFGPTDPKRHVTSSGRHEILYKKVSCSPCYKTTCQKGMKCLARIKPEEVFKALMRVMGEEDPEELVECHGSEAERFGAEKDRDKAA